VFPLCYVGRFTRAGPSRLLTVAREDMGSWLEGGRTGGGATGGSLGLPATGPGALAGVARRVVGLTIDWLLCLAISSAFLDADPMATLAVFAVENVVLVGTLGYTVGHRIAGLRVRALPGPDAGPGLGRAAVRTVLLCLVIPAVVWDADGRSLHDRAAGTAIVGR
jgi:uncharacterized RDD family membrane protein YckC